MFVDGGRRVMTETFFPVERFERASLFGRQGVAELREVVVHSLAVPSGGVGELLPTRRCRSRGRRDEGRDQGRTSRGWMRRLVRRG